MKSIALILLLFPLQVFCQPEGNGMARAVNGSAVSRNSFIKNIGQYGQTMAGHAAMGTIQYGFEGFNMRVLFTPKGIIHLHRKIEKLSERKERRLERKGIPEDEIEKMTKVIDKVITVEWVGADPAAAIVAEDETTEYHTYGLLQDKAPGYKKITYTNLYPGIDVVYHLTGSGKTGFEYRIIVRPGADPGIVKMKYGGDVKNISIDRSGNLLIRSVINSIMETNPVAFSNALTDQRHYPVSFQQQNNRVGFAVPVYDKTKTLVIDPFVSNTNAGLPGTNIGIAKDIDYDYEGNVYVAGGGDVFSTCKLAKYNAAGVLLWTFNGVLVVPAWTWGTFYGGWVVEKGSGNVFIGPGVKTSGIQVVRLSAAGVYDNYITVADPFFWETWKFLWSCNDGDPKILIAGGGINSNINLAVCSPPSTTLASTNLTGIATFAQDIADAVIDPLTNDIYTIFASLVLSPGVNNHIFKNPAPYSASTLAWDVPSGFTSLVEIKNRPYLNFAGGNTDNSVNALAVNSSYLYYWDGVNLKAFNKADGSQAGAVLTVASNTLLMQGGIVADECNNIFIGDVNGTIKVYKFNGSFFDDLAAPDINIPGYPTRPVYDLAYDEAHRLLYACGSGFVASFDISSYCASTVYQLTVTPDCPTLSVQATVSPAPPVGTVLTYALFAGATQVATNSTGLFSGLLPGTNYSIKAFLNQACSGTQLIENFTMDNCIVSVSATFINPSCNLPNGSIHAVAVNGQPPYQFSIDGINYQSSGIFTGLAAGSYAVIARDAQNSSDTLIVTLVNSLPLQATAVPAASSCTQYDGSITATGTGGAAPLRYSIDGVNYQLPGIFTGLAPGNYTVRVKDTNACTITVPVFVDSLNTVLVNAGSDVSICESKTTTLAATSNGSTVVWTPSTGLSNPNILTPIASPVITTRYIITATTGICKTKDSLDILVNPAPIANAGRDTGICFGKDIQLNGSGGIAYVWRPSTYLSGTTVSNPVVVQPPAGSITYRLTVTDANGCISLKEDDIRIDVSRPAKLFVGYDTSIAINQPLQLFGVDVFNAGFINYSWLPSYGLNNPFAKNPVAILDRDMVYNVTASNAFGCTATDDIKIKVYKGPEIYVPNSFTPNGDGLNDVLRPIVIGMKEFHYFSVYNSYGQLVFTSAVAANGWDGTFKGVKQPIGAYVWMAGAVDYKGNKIQRKGSAVLIR